MTVPYRVCRLYSGDQEWPGTVGTGQTLALVVFHLHQVQVPPVWRVHGKVRMTNLLAGRGQGGVIVWQVLLTPE